MDELFSKELLFLDFEAETRNEVLLALSRKLFEAGGITDADAFYEDVLTREKLDSTAMGRMIALPHGISRGLERITVVFARLKHPVLWDNTEPVRLVFLIAVPFGRKSGDYLKAIGLLAGKLLDGRLPDQLTAADSKDEVLAALQLKV